MIWVDVETTGLDRTNAAILSIGAIHYPSMSEFYIECCPTGFFEIDLEALTINGLKPNKDNVTPKIAVDKFIDWAKHECDDILLAGHNIGNFDALFLHKAYDGTFNMNWIFGRRFIDLHTVGYTVTGNSLSLDGILSYLGFPKEPKPHNALVGAKAEMRCYFELLKRMKT